MILDGKRLLITGVITKDSIAYHAAEQAQQEGAEVVLTSFGRVRRMTERAAQRLPEPADVLELDVNKPEDLDALTRVAARALGRGRRRAARDRLRARGRAGRQVHDRAGRERRAGVSDERVLVQGAGARRWQPLMDRGGSALVGLDFDATVAWPIYDWMGVAKAALESVVALPGARPRARGDPRQPRVGRPAGDGRRAGHPRLRAARRRCGAGRRRWAGTSTTRRRWPSTICLLLSDYARAISGEIVHVDGGFHAVGAPTDLS